MRYQSRPFAPRPYRRRGADRRVLGRRLWVVDDGHHDPGAGVRRAAGAAMGGPSTCSRSQLAALVTKGTITAAQEKSIVAALKSSMGWRCRVGQGGQPAAGSTPARNRLPAPRRAGSRRAARRHELDVHDGARPAGQGRHDHQRAREGHLAALSRRPQARRGHRLAAVRPERRGSRRRVREAAAGPGRAGPPPQRWISSTQLPSGSADEGDARPGALQQYGSRTTVPPAATTPGSTASMSSTSKAKWPKRSPPS